MPLDGGHLLLSDDEKEELLQVEPKAKKFILPLNNASCIDKSAQQTRQSS